MENAKVRMRACIWQNIQFKFQSLYALTSVEFISVHIVSFNQNNVILDISSSSTVIAHLSVYGKHACCMDLIYTLYWYKTRSYWVLQRYLIVVCVLENVRVLLISPLTCRPWISASFTSYTVTLITLKHSWDTVAYSTVGNLKQVLFQKNAVWKSNVTVFDLFSNNMKKTEMYYSMMLTMYTF